MRIGIIGATGFIGSALGRAAAERGHEVVAFSRRPGLNFSWAREIRAASEEGKAIDLSGLDALVNLAGESIFGLWTKTRRQHICDSRIQLTERVVESLEACHDRPRVFIAASAVGIYGNRGDEILTEQSSAGAGFLAGVCVAWEAAANRARALGVRVVNLRTSVVLGKGGGAWPMLRRVFGLGLGGRLGGGNQWMPWIHLDDETGIMLHALENENCSGPLNLAAPHPVTNAEFTKAVAGVLRRPAFFHAPAFALRLALGEFSHVVLDSERVEPTAAVSGGYPFRYPRIAGALASLA